ncbi:MAG TPA: hypothetical protein VI564_05120 [Candidatus Nanoarchaeia archaeon]|nr:hypothetical protein [Candidatus Nanoarchaeia archaeon]
MAEIKRIILRLKQDCSGNICPMPLPFIVKAVNGLKLIDYNETKEIAEFEYDPNLLNKDEIVSILYRKKYKVVE